MNSICRFKKIEKKSLATEVYQNIKQGIITGTLVEGTRLLENEIADQMGVSWVPVRGALTMLEGHRLIDFQVSLGAYERKLNIDEAREI